MGDLQTENLNMKNNDLNIKEKICEDLSYDDLYKIYNCIPYLQRVNNKYSDENCLNCFYSNGHYCSIKDIVINKHHPICWCYRNVFTMRTNNDFQDDNEDFDTYE